jgi:hypothetical protein
MFNDDDGGGGATKQCLYSGVVELQNNERLLKESLSVKLGRYH